MRMSKIYDFGMVKKNSNKSGSINDPLGQIHTLACRNIVFAWNLFIVRDFEKWGRTDRQSDVLHVRKQWSLPAVDQ